MNPTHQSMQEGFDAALERRIEFHRQCMCNAPTRERRVYHQDEMYRLIRSRSAAQVERMERKVFGG